MATVVYSNEEDGMCSFVIDGEEYVEDEERAIIPKAVLKQIRVEDIPDNFEIDVCESKDSSVIMVSVPMTFVKVGKNEFQVIYDELITRKYWDGPIGLKLYMETKKDVIEERSKEVGDVHLENYDDDGAYIHLVYSTKIYTDDMIELLSNMEQIYGEIEGATDITLGSPFSKIVDCAKENEFTIKILLPLFRKLGLFFELSRTYFLSCLGYVYCDLSNDDRQKLLIRLLLRNRLIVRMMQASENGNVNAREFLYMLSDSTYLRRKSNVKAVLNILDSSDEYDFTNFVEKIIL